MTASDGIRCVICGSERIVRAFTAVDRNLRTTDREFTIEVCRSCGTGRTTPVPKGSELAGFYPRTYYPSDADSEKYYRWAERFQLDKVRILDSYGITGRLLDVGCGVGYFLRAALGRGFAAEGVEFSHEAAALGRSRWNLRIAEGDLLSGGFGDGAFDAVTLWQVLEHLGNPRETLLAIHRILRAGGSIIVAVPNFDSIQAKIFRGRWYHLDVPRHLLHYTPAGLGRLMAECGFRIDGTEFGSAEHDYAGFVGSVMRISAAHETFLHRAVRKSAATTVARILAAAESAAGRGGTFTIIARKK